MSERGKGGLSRNPVVVAVELGDKRAVRRLAAEGAELSEPDANDETPLLVAGNDVEMVELLLQLGADPRIWSDVYAPPLVDSCLPDSEMGRLLKRYGYEATGEG